MSLRKLFGTRSRHHLAMEEFDPNVTTPASEDTTVVMKGPLADVYSEALLKTLDKNAPPEAPAADGAAAPAEGEAAAAPVDGEEPKAEVDTSNLKPAEGETEETVEAAIVSEVGNIVLESQAIDAAVASSLANSIADEAPQDNAGYETLYAIDETQVTPETVKDVTEILAEAEHPENVTVLIDDVVPDQVLDSESPTVVSNSPELAIAMESMVVALGGKVVHSFKDYVTARAQRSAK
jgi:DNA-directed RNA polymerase subunit F